MKESEDMIVKFWGWLNNEWVDWKLEAGFYLEALEVAALLQEAGKMVKFAIKE